MQVGCLLLPYYGNGLAGVFAVPHCNLFASIHKAVMVFVYCAVVAWKTLLGVGFLIWFCLRYLPVFYYYFICGLSSFVMFMCAVSCHLFFDHLLYQLFGKSLS